MAFVHQLSCEGIKSELDLFSLPTTQTSIEHVQWVEHQPVASIGTGGPIEFLLPGSGDHYLDLANTYLFVKARVVRGDGGNLPPDVPFHNFFSGSPPSLCQFYVFLVFTCHNFVMFFIFYYIATLLDGTTAVIEYNIKSRDRLVEYVSGR